MRLEMLSLFRFIHFISDLNPHVRDMGVDLGTEEKLWNLAFRDDLVCLFGCTEHAKRALDGFAGTAGSFTVCFLPSK